MNSLRALEALVGPDPPVWFRFYTAGFPHCHESCARNYFLVLWHLGENGTGYKMGLN